MSFRVVGGLVAERKAFDAAMRSVYGAAWSLPSAAAGLTVAEKIALPSFAGEIAGGRLAGADVCCSAGLGAHLLSVPLLISLPGGAGAQRLWASGLAAGSVASSRSVSNRATPNIAGTTAASVTRRSGTPCVRRVDVCPRRSTRSPARSRPRMALGAIRPMRHAPRSRAGAEDRPGDAFDCPDTSSPTCRSATFVTVPVRAAYCGLRHSKFAATEVHP